MIAAGLIWLGPVLALVTVVLLTPTVRAYLLCRHIVDQPDHRRSHPRPTPRGGGLAVLAGLFLALSLVVLIEPRMLPVLVISAILGLFGWLDDRLSLSVPGRLVVQLLVAGLMLASVGGISEISVAGQVLVSAWLWNLLAVIAIVWLINLHNFMDGADGLAASQGAWTGLAFGGLFTLAGMWAEAVVCFSVSGAYLGFLVWNRPPARIFMGDSGSILLGGMVAWMAVTGVSTGTISVALSLLICLLFVTDATATLLMRLACGEQWYTPHQQHAYQRLIMSGWSHGRVLAACVLVNVVMILPAVVVAGWRPEWEGWLVLIGTSLLLFGWWTIQSAANGDKKTHD